MKENSDVKIFVAWVNTLISDGYNLYELARIFKRDYEKIKNNKEVINNLQYFKEVKR